MGDIYFKIHYEKQNLDRARAQFRLVQDLEEKKEPVLRRHSRGAPGCLPVIKKVICNGRKMVPVLKALRPEEQAALRAAASERLVRQGEVIDNGAENCAGLLLVKRGQLRCTLFQKPARKSRCIVC